MPNPFVHIELNTDDVAKAKKFYKSIFKWNLTDIPAMGYTMLDVGKGTGGGMQKKPMPDAPNHWLAYVEVDDVKKTMAKAGSAGAQVLVDFMELPGMGALGIFLDPTGAALGVWQPARKPPRKAKPAAKRKR